jgi:hypothetical protein
MKPATKPSNAWMTMVVALALGAIPAACESAPELKGTWTGQGRLQQNSAGEIAAVDVVLNLTFDDRGGPDSLPALGMVSPPFYLYVVHTPGVVEMSLGRRLRDGGVVYASCGGSLDGPADEVTVRPVPPGNPLAGDSAVFQYRARFPFPDLLTHDYTSLAGAAAFDVDARDSYRTSRDGDGDRLTIESRAVGTNVATGAPLELRFEGQLTRGRRELWTGCPLRARRP